MMMSNEEREVYLAIRHGSWKGFLEIKRETRMDDKAVERGITGLIRRAIVVKHSSRDAYVLRSFGE